MNLTIATPRYDSRVKRRSSDAVEEQNSQSTPPTMSQRRRRRCFCSSYSYGVLVVICGCIGLYCELQYSRNSLGSNIILSSSSSSRTKQCNNVKNSHQRWRLMAFPYKTLGSGADMQCEWETNVINNNTNTHDWVQRTAYKEGICIPRRLRDSFHVFSSSDAIDCLSSKTLVISGDSYMQQMFFGVADVILSKAVMDGQEFRGKTERRNASQIVQKELDQRRDEDPCFPHLLWTGGEECYGSLNPFSEKCSGLINSYTKDNNNTVAAVGSFVHLLEKNSLNNTLKEIEKFLNLAKQTVWVSGVSHQIEKVAEQYKEKMGSSNYERGYNQLLQNVAPEVSVHPYLDIWQMTSSCVMENCSYDGHHRSRFVNRWKAQLLLNTICEVNTSMYIQ